MRLIITLSRSGLRCVTACILTKQTIGSEQNLRSGQCEPCFPEIKQRMPSLANCYLPFINQLLVAGSDKRLCIIDALSNQLDDLRAALHGVPYNWMFREVGNDGELLESAANAGNVRRQIGRFASKILGLPVTTKALGRQAAISGVQSNAAVSTADLAKCIGVTERTLPIYNTVSRETWRKVADAMAGIVEPAKVHSGADYKFEPKAYSLLPDEPTSSNAAAPVVPNTIPNMIMRNQSNPVVPNTMPNMVLPKCRPLIRTSPLSPSLCTLCTTCSLWVWVVTAFWWPFQWAFQFLFR